MNVFPYGAGPSNDTTLLAFYPAVYPTCTAGATYTNPATKFLSNDPGCFSAFFPAYSEVSYIAGREVVANFHFGIPHKSDAGKDDVQVLYTSSAQYRQFYSSADDAGLGFTNLYTSVDVGQQAARPDYYTYPGNTKFFALRKDPADRLPLPRIAHRPVRASAAFPTPVPTAPSPRCLTTTATPAGTLRAS